MVSLCNSLQEGINASFQTLLVYLLESYINKAINATTGIYILRMLLCSFTLAIILY